MSLIDAVIPQKLAVKALIIVAVAAVSATAGGVAGFKIEKASFASYKVEIERAKAAEIAAEFAKQKEYDDIAWRDNAREVLRQRGIADDTLRQLEEFRHAHRLPAKGGCPDDAGRALGVLKRAFPGDQGAGLPAPAGGADAARPQKGAGAR